MMISQALYCWTTRGLSGTHGFGFRAVSEGLSDRDLRALEPLCSDYRPIGETRHATGARRVLPDGRAALVRRVPTSHTDGRHVAHALVGDHRELEAAVAIALLNSHGWMDGEEELDPGSTELPTISSIDASTVGQGLRPADAPAIARSLAGLRQPSSRAAGDGSIRDAFPWLSLLAWCLPASQAALLCFDIGQAGGEGAAVAWVDDPIASSGSDAELLTLAHVAATLGPRWAPYRDQGSATVDGLIDVANAHGGASARVWEDVDDPLTAALLLSEPVVAQALVDALAQGGPEDQQRLWSWAKGLTQALSAGMVQDNGASSVLADAAVRAASSSPIAALTAIQAGVLVCGGSPDRFAVALGSSGAPPWLASLAQVLSGFSPEPDRLDGIAARTFVDFAKELPALAAPDVVSAVIQQDLDGYLQLLDLGMAPAFVRWPLLRTEQGLGWLARQVAAGNVPLAEAFDHLDRERARPDAYRSFAAAAPSSDQSWVEGAPSLLAALEPLVADMPPIAAAIRAAVDPPTTTADGADDASALGRHRWWWPWGGDDG